MRICAVKDCHSSTYQLKKWREQRCSQHDCLRVECDCPEPFTLFTFPTEKGDPQSRQKWIQAVNRKCEKTGKNWEPKYDDRVCSKHFVVARPTAENPFPSIDLGYEALVKAKKTRPPPKARTPPAKKAKTDTQETSEASTQSHCDHDYKYKGDCFDCLEKEKIIHKQEEEIEQLKKIVTAYEIKSEHQHKKTRILDTILKNDEKVRIYTGIPNKKCLEDLSKHLSVKAKKIRYWSGPKKVISTKVPRKFKGSPQKPGRKRKMTQKEEMVAVMMKLRLGIQHVLISDLFNVSLGHFSQIFNTWVKFLAQEFRSLVFWPNKETIKEHLPQSLKQYPNLRCTIDCTEVFIDRPRHLELQALTWSDYKKNNTVKFLVGIAPNGMITFLSKAWGGRASDQLITRESGFLRHIEPTDLILADRGFTIKEDLMMRGATLEIPPPSSGLEQMSRQKVKKTKKIANARIHVERAIGRMKWFAILKHVLPINLVPLMDDIIVICAGLCNLLPPLVK